MIGRADSSAIRDALKAACATRAAGTTIADCMKKMGSDKPADGPVAEARRQLPMLRASCRKGSRVDPGTEQAQVEESPPYNRQNSAYIDIPGPYEKGLPSVYYISRCLTRVGDKQTQLDQAKKDLLFTSVHEVWPGLHFLHSNRAGKHLRQ